MENNEDLTFEEKFKRFSNNLLNAAPLICGILIAIWWIFFGMVEIYPNKLSITDRIGLTVCTAAFAIVYSSLISAGGFNSAESSDEMSKIINLWREKSNEGRKYRAEILEYAKDIAVKNVKELRTENLENNGLRYYDIFNDKGELIKLDYKRDVFNKRKNPTGLMKYQIKTIKKCIKLRANSYNVFGDLGSKVFGVKKRVSKKEFNTINNTKDFIIKVILSAFSVGFAFKFLGLSWNTFVYSLFQIALWSGAGILRRLKNYNFVINEIKPQIEDNIDIIDSFLKLDEHTKDEYTFKVNQNKKIKLLECKEV